MCTSKSSAAPNQMVFLLLTKRSTKAQSKMENRTTGPFKQFLNPHFIVKFLLLAQLCYGLPSSSDFYCSLERREWNRWLFKYDICLKSMSV